MHSLAPPAGASGALLLPFPTASSEKASPKSTAVAAKAQTGSVSQFPELLAGLVEASDQADTQPSGKEESPRPLFWLSSAQPGGQALAQVGAEPAPTVSSSSLPAADPAATATDTAATPADEPVAVAPASTGNTPKDAISPGSQPLAGQPLVPAGSPADTLPTVAMGPGLSPDKPRAQSSTAPESLFQEAEPTVPAQTSPSAGPALPAKSPTTSQAARSDRNQASIAGLALAGSVPHGVDLAAAGSAQAEPPPISELAAAPDKQETAPEQLPERFPQTSETTIPAETSTSPWSPLSAKSPATGDAAAATAPLREPETPAPTSPWSPLSAKSSATGDAAGGRNQPPFDSAAAAMREPSPEPENPASTSAGAPAPAQSPAGSGAAPIDGSRPKVGGGNDEISGASGPWQWTSSEDTAPAASPARQVTLQAAPQTARVATRTAPAARTPPQGFSNASPLPPAAGQLSSQTTGGDASSPAGGQIANSSVTSSANQAAPVEPAASASAPIQATGSAAAPHPKNPQRPWVRNQFAAAPAGDGAQPIVTAVNIAPATAIVSATPLPQPAPAWPKDGTVFPPSPPLAGGSPSRSGNPARPTDTAAATAAPSADGADGSQAGQTSQIAFTATLKPMDAAPEDMPVASTQSRPQAPPRNSPAAVRWRPAGPETPEATPVPDDGTDPAESSSRGTAASSETQPDAGPPHERKPADNSVPESAVGAGGPSARPLGTPDIQPLAGARSTERAGAADAPAPAATPPADPAPPPAQAATAHDIKLEVGGAGEPRVEVRVTERGGDVHVAVRTPDSRLAGDLREDLPALATRLEQSGFHATTWQPAAGGDRQHSADPPAGASSQDPQNQSRQNGGEQQGDPREQQPKEPENPDHPSQPKEQGKDFAWLLSSIQ